MSKQKSRREILRKTAYIVPTVMTLAVKPTYASTGSGQYDGQNERRGGEWEDHSNSRYEYESKKSKKNGKKH
jgi:hypothetical protein